ncbi:MAG TPA: septum site-determining protein Ssd [Mycobacteriales bacterium]|nr:septum site-determining protein Ssd [Mycobacteriales bacterium]
MARPLVVTGSDACRSDVQRLVAAAAVEADVVADVAAARRLWADAPIVLVGDDIACSLVEARVPRRRGVVLVGHDLDDALVWQRAVELGADHVIFLPDAEAWLVGRLADTAQGTPAGTVVGVVGGRGGAGATTLAVALALTAQRDGHPTFLLDADPVGGGLDVVLGAEDATGARWPDVAAVGHRLSAEGIAAAVPLAHGVRLLSWDRGEHVDLSPGVVSCVLEAARRAASALVVDLPRANPDVMAEALGVVDTLLVVTTGEVRAAAATSRIASLAARYVTDVRLVVRGPCQTGLSPAMISDAVALPLAASIRSDRDCAGELPAGLVTGGRSHLTRAVTRLARSVFPDARRGGVPTAA